MMAPKNHHYSSTSSLNDCITTMVGTHNYSNVKFYTKVAKIIGFTVDCCFQDFLQA